MPGCAAGPALLALRATVLAMNRSCLHMASSSSSPTHVRSTQRQASAPSHAILQAYFEARFGCEAWEQLDKIPKEMWCGVAVWLRG